MSKPTDTFKEVHWNIAEAGAWVYRRNWDLAGQQSDSCDEKPSAAQVAIEASRAWADAKNEIIVALQEGRVQASGIRVGTTVRAGISAPEWANLQFKLDSDQAMATNSLGIYEPQWEKLKFHREDILANWPEVEMQSVVPLPSDITKNELRAWIKQDTWTAGEAMLLLHGKTPRNPWLRNDELTTHFSEAKRYLDRALQSGTIGERRHADVQEQWIDTPTRWHEWASGEIPVPPVVQTAFLEHRYATAPRVHYVRAKRRLQEKIPCHPEEIAMWLFTNELIAWHGDKPESRRFTFDWLSMYEYDEKGKVEDYDYVRRLTDIFFSDVQIKEFEPVERWMTYQDILDRWAASMTTTEATDLVLSLSGPGELSATHLLMGWLQGDHKPTIENYMFPLSRIKEVEAAIGIELHQTTIGLVSAERDCRGWLEGLMRNGQKKRRKKSPGRKL